VKNTCRDRIFLNGKEKVKTKERHKGNNLVGGGGEIFKRVGTISKKKKSQGNEKGKDFGEKRVKKISGGESGTWGSGRK